MESITRVGEKVEQGIDDILKREDRRYLVVDRGPHTKNQV